MAGERPGVCPPCKVIIKTVKGPTAYSTGGFEAGLISTGSQSGATVGITELKNIVAGGVLPVVQESGQAIATVQSGNILKVKLVRFSGVEVAANTDLSTMDFTLSGFGY